MDIPWDEKNDDVKSICMRYGLNCDALPKQYKYTSFDSIIQKGPTCGFVALAMYCGFVSHLEIEKIITEARLLNYTIQGELFSAKFMYSIAKNNINKRVEIFTDYLLCQYIINFLLNGGVLIVPYDSDANHAPCNKNGHKAHWALVSGIIEDDQEIYIFARHGKSKLLALWSLRYLADSNSQLNEVCPKRREGNKYIIPDGGISGDSGLKKKCILIYH